MSNSYLVKTFHGLEGVLAEEIIALGGQGVTTQNRAVSCSGDLEFGYRLNYWTRTAISVLQPIVSGQVRSESELYDLVQSIHWFDLFGIDKTFLVRAVCYSDLFKHSHYLALKVKDAIVDQFRDKFHRRPSIAKDPNLKIDLFIKHDHCIISLDLSGASLFKRGYRLKTGEAPINEVLAAGIIKRSGWQRSQPLVDPMCGAGTIPIEAQLMAENVSPQFLRSDFAFQHLHSFDRRLWQNLLDNSEVDRSSHSAIYGSDIDSGVLRMARGNARNAGLSQIHWKVKDFFHLKPPASTGILIFNPPYDERLKLGDAIKFYRKIGDQLKQQWTGWTAYLLSSHLQAIKQIGLRTSKKMVLFNGPLECRLLRIELF